MCYDEYAHPENEDNVCNINCKYYTDIDGYKYCTTECPEEYEYLVPESRNYCVSDCS